MSELQRLKGLLPPENQSWVFIEAAVAIDPPLITLEEIGRDEVEIQVDLEQWEYLAQDHRNLLVRLRQRPWLKQAQRRTVGVVDENATK